MTRRYIPDDALSRKLAALPQPALPRDFAPVVLAHIARTPAARPRRSVRSERAWAPWAIGIGALLALGLFTEVSPLMGRVSGLELLRLPWTVHVWLALAVGLYVLGLVATLRPKIRASL